MSVDGPSSIVLCRIAKWVPSRNEISSSKVHGIVHIWEASSYCGLFKMKKVLNWPPPVPEVLKFNVERATRGKPRPAGIVVVFRNYKGTTLVLSSKHVGIVESNEAEVLAALEALWIYTSFS